jgi:hypothetical protein
MIECRFANRALGGGGRIVVSTSVRRDGRRITFMTSVRPCCARVTKCYTEG